MNWKAFTEEFGSILAEELNESIVDAAEDLRDYGLAVARDLTIALRSGREDLREELLEQAKLLAEVRRIDLNKKSEAVLERILDIGMRIGITALTI